MSFLNNEINYTTIPERIVSSRMEHPFAMALEHYRDYIQDSI